MALSQVGLERLNTATTKKIGTNKNIIINGAMQVAQRGTSSTGGGYETIDRFASSYNGTDEAPTQAQVNVAAGTTPYTLGFRKAWKFTNGNQTGGAGSSDRVEVAYKAESQDIANSGWNYTSSSSFITLSFWIKSSVAQNFFGRLLSADGTAQRYAFETGSLTADTWTKITKTIPGNSNLQFDNNNEEGLKISWYGFAGTDFTDSSSLNTWAAGVSGNRTPDQTSTWYTTNDSTLELTGVQLEVGSVATDFEHRSFGQELALCQRYYQRWKGHSDHNGIGAGRGNGSSGVFVSVNLLCCMRASPSVTNSGIVVFRAGTSSTSTSDTPSLTNASAFDASHSPQLPISVTGLSGINNNQGGYTVFLSGSDLTLDAEF